MWHSEVNSLHRFLPNLGPLRLREFRLLYIGQFVSAFGSAMTYVVLPFQMYALTRSALAVGLIGVVEFVPMLTMALIGGALADHFDRRRLIGFVEFAMVLCCAVLAWNAALPTPHVAVLWIGAGLLAGLGALHRPAMEALVQQVGDYVGSRVMGRRNRSLRFRPFAVAGADIPCSRRSGGHGKRHLSDGGLEPDDSLVDTRSYCCNRNG